MARITDLNRPLPPLLELDEEDDPTRLSREELAAAAGPGWAWSRPEMEGEETE
jgi:hypothetical protein